MTYQDTLDWMFKQLPMYQNQGKSAFKKDLSNTLKLSHYLKHPENTFKSIHIAGTNGKGSTSHMVASILQEAGYKVGLYTSPHLKDFRERIKINGKSVSKQFVIGFIAKHKKFLEEQSLSFFEMTVGMAFQYFSAQKIDVAVIEVGLGGRLDSTNIISPLVSVITNIGLDHTQFLGDTLELIALEKAGIIKPKTPVVIGETQSETKDIFIQIASKNKSKIVFADQQSIELYPSDLKGSYQSKNIITTIQTIKEVKRQGFDINTSQIKRGLLHVTKNTGLLGRWQQLREYPKVFCDTAHNKEGLTYVMDQISKEDFKSLHIVFGVVNDKDLNTIVHLLPKTATYYFCKPNIPRGLDAEILRKRMHRFGLKGNAYRSVNKAYEVALRSAELDDFLFIGGSTFVVAEII